MRCPAGLCKTVHASPAWTIEYLLSVDEADELEHLVTSQTESVNIDHPNHTVTVTTISDLDLSGARQLGLTTHEVGLFAVDLIQSLLH